MLFSTKPERVLSIEEFRQELFDQLQFGDHTPRIIDLANLRHFPDANEAFWNRVESEGFIPDSIPVGDIGYAYAEAIPAADIGYAYAESVRSISVDEAKASPGFYAGLLPKSWMLIKMGSEPELTFTVRDNCYARLEKPNASAKDVYIAG